MFASDTSTVRLPGQRLLMALGNGSALPRKLIGICSGIRNGTRQAIRSGDSSLTAKPAVNVPRTGNADDTRTGIPGLVNQRWEKTVSPDRAGPGTPY